MFSNDHRSTVSPGWQGCSSGRGRVGFASRRETRSMSAHPILGRGGGTSFMEGQGLRLCHLLPTSQQTSRLNQAHNGGNGSSAEVRYRPHPRPPSGAQRWSPHLSQRDPGPEVSGVVTNPLSRVPARVLPPSLLIPIERSPVRFRSKGKFHSLIKDRGGGSLLRRAGSPGAGSAGAPLRGLSHGAGAGFSRGGTAQAQLGCSRSRPRAWGSLSAHGPPLPPSWTECRCSVCPRPTERWELYPTC